jgi:hypothetical protein
MCGFDTSQFKGLQKYKKNLAFQDFLPGLMYYCAYVSLENIPNRIYIG